MEYRYLGKSGLQVSALSFGSWVTFGNQIDDKIAADCMHAAYDAGVNFFDNAEVYANGESETVMGKVIKDAGWKRSDLVVSTKLFWGGQGPNDRGLSHKHIVEGLDASLGRLQLDYVDLLFCHRPDIHTPMEETVRAMTHVINQGKAFYWGTSEWSAEEIMRAYTIARREHLIPPLMEQPQYNMLARDKVEAEYMPLYAEIGLGTTIWSPLAGGLLTGKYNDGSAPEGSRAATTPMDWLKNLLVGEDAQPKIAKVKALEPIAAQCECSLAQLALAWCLKNPNVSTVITGASRAEQVVENMQALEVSARLSAEIMEKIDHVLENKPTPAMDFRG
ncbi:MAG: aldo/keto reductase [Myxococcota bacterium]|nr:aldo/keto reductase [Myxococcota bacterium]